MIFFLAKLNKLRMVGVLDNINADIIADFWVNFVSPDFLFLVPIHDMNVRLSLLEMYGCVPLDIFDFYFHILRDFIHAC